MALLGMLGPMVSSGMDMDPDDHFFTQDHHNHQVFDPIHHGIPHQQDRFNIPNATISPDTITNASFFQIPPGVRVTDLIPGTTSTAAVLTSSTTTMTQRHYRQDSPASTQSSSSKRRTTHSTDLDEAEPVSDETQAAIKRQRNTMAARKYRQKRLDRIADLERALTDMTGERDELKLKLARREAEVEALREMLGRR